ncbi:MAG: hypothetical protein A2504_10965 [Bdellovibrionales bacterium RIFOXYD12_FULL_39_22]|nr:MAG: hypothetical protein A2385_09530 [Bdellovibrionales bacterium RIFOXYB1_FULL_39_21]OFZ44199.1 MAG: hypothetical protein A2485_07150 [Bdellovibrionales bacterium RIFOXYC12_FULL_39_17]OFZ46741.1 MAG: hypothetical protein A2404_04385 [Bdellovibrionales bacterium RIFOXYC1_FULL_39_130]OFZ75982.1 MAG: hypothetical protein A2560_02765 [Bdellovibrionales bacterium RIFOXYD1_FULL_39_84]OFZ95421.1 MAG: hypothetical protein A2504_10965 [Bdellovibrionales bacterium RIFOXYD12_FULL_39_22]HLE09850.1 hy
MFSKIEYQSVDIPFLAPMQLGHKIYNTRAITYITLIDQKGNRYLGEVAPLPGFNHESKEEAAAEIGEFFSARIKNRPIPLEQFSLTTKLCNFFATSSSFSTLSPSAYFALESIFLDYLYKNAPQTFFPLINGQEAIVIESARLLTLAKDQKNREDLYGQTTTAKIKIGRLPLAQEISYINSLPPHIKLRLDGNNLLSANDLVVLLSSIESTRIEFLEEPLANMERDWEKIYARYQVPLACEASLQREISLFSGFNFLIVKPTAMGICEAAKLINLHPSKKIIISSAFVSPHAMRWHLFLAYLQNKLAKQVHGLDTLRYLKLSNATEEISFLEGKLRSEFCRTRKPF